MQKMQTSAVNSSTTKVENNLRSKYLKKIKPELKDQLGMKNIYQAPSLVKLVVNVGFGKTTPDKKQRDHIATVIGTITGQRPFFTTAKKSIAGFKIQKGQIIGAKVTLRGAKMYHFFEKLVSIVLPRLRDFRGMNEKSFDGRGNYSIGFKEVTVFPEVEYARGERPFSLEVVITTTARKDEEAKALLLELGMPFRELAKKNKKGASKNN